MKSDARSVYVLDSARTPFSKSHSAYSDVSRNDLMVAALRSLVEKSGLKGRLLGDVALGAVMNGSADFNLAREAVLDTELHPETPAYNVQRACGTSLETTWQIALKAHVGAIDIGIAGGVDTNSDVPIEVSRSLRTALVKFNQAKSVGEKVKALIRLSPKDLLPRVPGVREPRTHLSMGEHCELMVKEWGILRADQDELALVSHMNGAKAYDSGFYEGLVFPFQGLTKDTILRSETTIQKLATLKPAFDPVNGTLTAGNSSPLSDGAACVLIANDRGAQELGVEPLARIVDVQVAAVDFVHGAGLLMAPTKAVARLLTRNRLSFEDFDFFEIHEAFAGQVLCTLKAFDSGTYCRDVLGLKKPLGSIDRARMNVVGSSLALGHPFAATGARIVGTLAKLLAIHGESKRGLISICTAGGMGVAAILERP